MAARGPAPVHAERSRVMPSVSEIIADRLHEGVM